jgi:hypothetical protein
VNELHSGVETLDVTDGQQRARRPRELMAGDVFSESTNLGIAGEPEMAFERCRPDTRTQVYTGPGG